MDDGAKDSAAKRKEALRHSREFLFARQRSYHLVFPHRSEAAKAVLDDLARFCRAEETTFHADARIHAVLEGRREVWLRIQEHLRLSSEELWMSVTKKKGASL